MITATLTRQKDDGQCTLGTLVFSTGQTFKTIERPWLNNQRQVSCIPPGTYTCVPHGWEPNATVREKKAYLLLGTEPRTAILIHPANWAAQLMGCIAPGMSSGILGGKPAVLSSQAAMASIRQIVGQNKFQLTIKGM